MNKHRMPSFSFIHCADLHLDSPFVGISSDEFQIASRLKSATFDAFENVIKAAIERRVDFILISGDVYDGSDRSLHAQWRFRNILKLASDNGIFCFVAHGNHDPLSGWEADIEFPDQVIRFGPEVEYHEFKRDGKHVADIYGISYPERELKENLAKRFKRQNKDVFSIGVLHANVGNYKGHDNYAPCTIDDLKETGLDYWALGHIHARGILNEADPVIVYPGNTQGRSIRESGERGCYLVKIDELGGTKMDFIETDTVRWYIHEQDIADFDNPDQLTGFLKNLGDEIRELSSGRGAIMRFVLKGRGGLHSLLSDGKHLSDIIDRLREGESERDDFFWVDSIKNQTLPDIDIEKRRQQDDFVADFLKKTEKLKNSENFEEEIKEALLNQPEANVVAHEIENMSYNALIEIIEKAEVFGLDNLLKEDGS